MVKNIVIVEFLKISGDQFYSLLTGQDNALFQLYKVLPKAINDYLKSVENDEAVKENSALEEINLEVNKSKRSILNQITFENYSYFSGFDKL